MSDSRNHHDDDTDEGAVSEVDNLGAAEEIQPDQSVAAAPGEEGDDTEEGRQGPNAVTGEENAPE